MRSARGQNQLAHEEPMLSADVMSGTQEPRWQMPSQVIQDFAKILMVRWANADNQQVQACSMLVLVHCA